MGGDSDRSVKGNRALDAINRATLDAADPLGSLLSMRPARPDGTPYGRDDLPVARSFDRGERVANEEVVITHSDGEQSILSVNSGPVMGDDGTIFAAVMTVSDITGRVRREGQLRTLTRDLTRSNEELQQFAYIASHDLQEPLRMVISYLGLLEKRYDDKLDESGRTFIFYAVDGAKRMQVLINDILAFSRVESRAAPFVDTDLNQALQEAISTLEASLREYGGSVTAERLPTVRADRAQMAQLLRNLIGNALKFHGPEPPVVKVYAESSPSEWTVTVEDNGIGMAPEYHDKIFRMFERLNRQEDYPGTGIGLAICKKIVERHGGRIWAESEPGKGSKFRFTIPVKNENER